MKNTSLFPVFLLAAAALLLANSVYVIREIDRAVLLTFGEVTNADVSPGLHFKVPGMHAVRRFDGRIQTLDIETESYLTAEKNYLEVDSYAKWRVADTARFYTATSGDEARIDSLLQQRINTELRNQFGTRTVHEVVAGERDLLMTTITERLNRDVLEQLGIEVVDVRVKRIDLPDNVSDSVFIRMNTERQEEAQQLRSTGLEIAEGIRADADRQQTILEAEAYRDAERTRGEGDAEATAIYAQAFSKDAEFYEFTRSLNAYRESLGGQDDLLLLSPNGDFFKYLKNSDAQPR
jgi:membrane protease subunit HflC